MSESLKYDYNNFQYTNEIKKLLDEVELNEETLIELKNKMEKNLLMPFYCNHKGILKDLYKFRFILNKSTYEIAEIYNVSNRTVQKWLENLEWKRTRIEAQQIAVQKRDYTKIRRTYKRTMLDNLEANQLIGSKPEQYIRNRINLDLPELIKGGEIIVGINNIGIISTEIDIPLIIFKNDKTYKYAIEINGVSFHKPLKKQENDLLKRNEIIKKGYRAISITTKSYYNNNTKEFKKINLELLLNKLYLLIVQEVEHNIFIKDYTLIE